LILVDVDAATGKASAIRRLMLDEAGLARLQGAQPGEPQPPQAD
jgi:hypothetical protein